MKSLTMIALGLILPSLLVVSNVQARGMGKNKGMQKEMMKSLNMTPEQKTKMKEIRQANRAKRQAMMTELTAAKDKFQQIVKSNGSDAEIQSAHNALHAIMNKKSNARIENMLAIRKILTADQQKKFMDKRSEMIGMHGKKGMKGRKGGM